MNQVVREYSECKLAQLPISLGDKDDVLEKVKIWRSSLKVDELKSFFKEDLIKNLQYLNNLLVEAGEEPIPFPNKNANKTICATALVDARTKAKDLVQDGDFASPGVWSDHTVTGDTMKEKLENALDEDFFKVSDAVKLRMNAENHRVNLGGHIMAPSTPQNLQPRPPQAALSTGNCSYSSSVYSA